MFTAMRLLCSILLLFSLINYEVSASDSFHHCYSSENFTINSPYGGSRNGQLYGLAELVKQQDGFYEGNTITIPPSPVPYCFGLCRKDLISSDACYNCIGKSTSEILSNCPVQKEVIAWGGDAGCIVRCFPPSKSLRPYETYPAAQVCNKTNISHNYLPQFGHLLANLTSRIAVRAAEGTTSSFPSGYNDRQYFPTEESTLSDLHQTIYAVGFCIPSLSTSDCSACLQAAANKSSDYCSGKQGATVLMPSCVIRYELFPFYKISSATPLPSPSPSPPRSFPVSKGSKKRKVLLTAIILPLVAFLTITVLIIRYTGIWRRKKNTRTNKDYDTGSQSMESCHEFSLNTVRAATNDFSDSNKLGQGGFGVVYKAWKCWTTGELHRLIDPILLRSTAQTNEIKQYIHIGLLCVQENVIRRPTMNLVILLLEGCSQSLLLPSEPAYLMQISSDEANVPIMEDSSKSRVNESEADTDKTRGLSSLSSQGFSSVNEVTFTHTYPEPR